MLCTDAGNAVQHNSDNTHEDGKDQQDVEAFAGWGICFKNDFVKTQLPGCKFAAGWRSRVGSLVGIGCCAHFDLFFWRLMEYSNNLPVAG